MTAALIVAISTLITTIAGAITSIATLFHVKNNLPQATDKEQTK